MCLIVFYSMEGVMRIKKHSNKFLLCEAIVMFVTLFVLNCLKVKLRTYIIVSVGVYLIFVNVWYGVIEKNE
jgi:hypothetical protein